MGLFDRFKKGKSEYSYEMPEQEPREPDWIVDEQGTAYRPSPEPEPIDFQYAKSPYDQYKTGHIFESGAVDFDKATEPDIDDVNKQADDVMKKKARVETEREQEVRERREQIEDLEQESKIRKLRSELNPEAETERQKSVRERKEHLEDLQLKGAKSEFESKYTRTGQLKSQLKEAGKEMLTGGKKPSRYSKDHDLTSAERVKKVVRNVSTLGGAVRISNLRKHFYVPKADTGFYVPTKTTGKKNMDLYSSRGMQSLNMPAAATHGASSSTLRRAGTPSYEKLRQASTFKHQQATGMQPRVGGAVSSPIAKLATGSPSHLAKPMGFVKVGSQAQDVAMERLRGLSFPVGLTTTEKLAYAEIKDNNDIDTKAHVVSELMSLGIDKLEASRAVEGLMHRKIAVRGKNFDGEPTLEIAK